MYSYVEDLLDDSRSPALEVGYFCRVFYELFEPMYQTQELAGKRENDSKYENPFELRCVFGFDI